MIDVMRTSNEQLATEEHCGICACGVEPLAYPKYSFGMLLEARSLALEHGYHAMRMNAHNIRLHDFGTICGLRVDKHPSPQCVNTFAILRAGIALDCCGRELVVPEDLFVPLKDGATSGWCGAAMGTLGTTPAPSSEPSQADTTLYIYLRYAQCDTDPIPTYVRTCGCCAPCEHDGCTPSVTREGYEVFVSTAAPIIWSNPVGRAFCEWLDVKLNGPGSSAPATKLYNETLAQVLCGVITEPCADFCRHENDRLLLATVAFNADGELTSIDNVTGRRLVLSTGAIVEALECLTRAEIKCCSAYLTLGATVTPPVINLAALPPRNAVAYTVTVTNADVHKEAASFELALAFQSGNLTFVSASLTIADTAQPAPSGGADGVTVTIPPLAAGAFAQLVVTATFNPAQHKPGDTIVSVASIEGYAGGHDSAVTLTTPFVKQEEDGPRVVLSGWLTGGQPNEDGSIVVDMDTNEVEALLRDGFPFEFTEPMDAASAIPATSESGGSVTITVTENSGATVLIPCAISWRSAKELAVTPVPEEGGPARYLSDGAFLSITLAGGPKGGLFAGDALKGADGARLDGSPAVGNISRESGDGMQGGNFVVIIPLSTRTD